MTSRVIWERKFVWILILKQELNQKLKKSDGAAGDWTRDFSHAKRALYHWATAPLYMEILF